MTQPIPPVGPRPPAIAPVELTILTPVEREAERRRRERERRKRPVPRDPAPRPEGSDAPRLDVRA